MVVDERWFESLERCPSLSEGDRTWIREKVMSVLSKEVGEFAKSLPRGDAKNNGVFDLGIPSIEFMKLCVAINFGVLASQEVAKKILGNIWEIFLYCERNDLLRSDTSLWTFFSGGEVRIFAISEKAEQYEKQPAM